MKKQLFVFTFSFFVFNCSAQSWYPLGSGLVGSGQYDRVNTLCGDSINHIMWAGGSFQMAGGDSIGNLSGWTGAQWIPVRYISNGDTIEKIFTKKITALIMYNNELIIAEAKDPLYLNRANVFAYNFSNLTLHRIASFNKEVNVFHIYHDTLFAAGEFSNSKDTLGVTHTTKCIAKWDGTYFVNVGVGLFGTVNAMCTYNGNLITAGQIVGSTGAGTSEHALPAWNGAQWISVVDSFGATVDYNNINISSLCEYNGKLFIGCSETFGELPSDLMIWDGVNWLSSNPVYGGLYALKLFGQNLFIAGNSFQFFPWYSVTKYDDSIFSWTGKCPLDCGFNCISSFGSLNGQLYAGGQFSYIGDTPYINATYSRFIARFDQTPLPTVTAGNTNLVCNNDCNGMANATATGVGQLTYLWSNGATTDTITNLCAGTYTVTVTDSLGITVSDSVAITEPPPITVIDTSTNASCATCSNGSASVTVSGGTPPLIVMWSNGKTTNTIDSLIAGNYYLTVTDSNGCVTVDSVIVGFDAGVEQLLIDNGQLIIYPNPANEIATAQWNGIANEIELKDLLGRSILKQTVTPAERIKELNISNLNSGIYFLTIKTVTGNKTVKVVRE